MQKWLENFAKEWVEYPFLVMPTNANSIANAQCERTLRSDEAKRFGTVAPSLASTHVFRVIYNTIKIDPTSDTDQPVVLVCKNVNIQNNKTEQNTKSSAKKRANNCNDTILRK